MNENLLLVAQLTKTSKTIEFWSDLFIVKDLKNGVVSIDSSYLVPKYKLYNLCDSLENDFGLIGPISLIAQDNDRT